MNPKALVSAIVLTKNEEARIEACLKNLLWAKEIIVIDNGSVDRTVTIAQKYNASVIVDHRKDFSCIRNAGAQHAAGKWLLYVDADETVTLPLRREIEEAITSNTYSSYFIPRVNYYLGRKWPHKDGMVRLIRKDALIRWEGVLHEHAKIKGATGTLINCFIHKTHRTLSEMVEKTNEWSEHEAQLRYSARHPRVVGWRLLRVMCWAFWNSYIRQGGWKAGTTGWIESIYQSFSIFITYAKLWEIQQQKHETDH